jgi:hypothetical protein
MQRPITVPSSTFRGCEQRGGAVPLVVVRHGCAAAFLHGKAWLGSIKCLNLALFVDRQHHSMLGRSDVKPDDGGQFLGELRVVGQLEQACAARLQAMLAPYPLHRTDADGSMFGHRARRPVGCLARRGGLRGGDHAGLHLRRKRRNARATGLVTQQARHALGQEAVLPPPDRGLAGAGPAGEFHGAAAIGSQQHDLRPPNVFLRAIAVRHDGDQRLAVGFSEVNFGGFAHPPDSHGQVDDGILNRM